MTMTPSAQATHWIHGQANGQHQSTFDKVCPVTAKTQYACPIADDDTIHAAFESAAAGFAIWRETSTEKRAKILLQTAALIEENSEAIAQIEVSEIGKPYSEAISDEALFAARTFRYFAGLAQDIGGRSFDFKNHWSYSQAIPYGICVGIGAWNYPFQIASWKAAPALAAGNAMIFKPSELSPRSVTFMAELLKAAGLPDGVFNVIQGDGRTGATLSSHPQTAKVSFTGSVATGQKILAQASKTLAPVTLELGGKSPFIVFEDADIDAAVEGAFDANFYNTGQVCSNGTRVYVHESLIKSFTDKVIARLETYQIGEPAKPETQMGPIVSAQQFEKVQRYIAVGKEEGATLCYGGQPLDGPGYFMSPAVFTDCTDSMTICREEIFGPVMCILPFSDETDVITRANQTDFGLAAGLFTRDLARAHRVAAQLQAGTCWVNTYNAMPMGFAFGGVKHSGFGRENAREAFASYTQLKSILVSKD